MEEIIQTLEAEKALTEKGLDRIDRLIALAGSGVPQGAREVGQPKAGKIRRSKGGRGWGNSPAHLDPPRLLLDDFFCRQWKPRLESSKAVLSV